MADTSGAGDFLQLSGKTFLVAGVANKKSVAYHVGAQLKEHDRALQATLNIALPTQKLGPLIVPARMGTFMQCAAGTERERDRPYDVNSYYCYTLSSLYVDQKL